MDGKEGTGGRRADKLVVPVTVLVLVPVGSARSIGMTLASPKPKLPMVFKLLVWVLDISRRRTSSSYTDLGTNRSLASS